MGFCEILAFLCQNIWRYTPHDHNRDTFLPLIPAVYNSYRGTLVVLPNLVVKLHMSLY